MFYQKEKKHLRDKAFLCVHFINQIEFFGQQANKMLI